MALKRNSSMALCAVEPAKRSKPTANVLQPWEPLNLYLSPRIPSDRAALLAERLSADPKLRIVDSEDAALLVLPSFEFEELSALQKRGKRVVGLPLVERFLKDRSLMEKVMELPLFDLLYRSEKGLCFSAMAPEDRSRHQAFATWVGARVTDDIGPDTELLVARKVSLRPDSKYQAALALRLPIVRPSYVKALWDEQQLVDKEPHFLPPLAGLAINFGPIQDQVSPELRKRAEASGAVITTLDKAEVVIVTDASKPIYQEGRRLGLLCAPPLWLERCLQIRCCLTIAGELEAVRTLKSSRFLRFVGGLQEALSCFSPLAGPPDLQHHTVKLHIYDLPGLAPILNTCLKGILGIYRTGVQVHGREWSFSSNGIVECCPGGCAYPLYRESVNLGTTSLSEDEVKMLLHRFDSAWVASEYHCIRRNCSDFSEALCVALGVARPPRTFSCSCYPGKEAARHADLKRAMAERKFVEGRRVAGAMRQENSSPVSTRLPSLLSSPQSGESTTVLDLHKGGPPPPSSLQVATRVLLPLGCLQRTQDHDCDQAGAEELGDVTRLQSHSNAPRKSSAPSIDSNCSYSSESDPAAQLKEGKRRGRSPTVRLRRNSDWEVVRAAARMRAQMKAACAYFRKKKKEDMPWPGSQDMRWMVPQAGVPLGGSIEAEVSTILHGCVLCLVYLPPGKERDDAAESAWRCGAWTTLEAKDPAITHVLFDVVPRVLVHVSMPVDEALGVEFVDVRWLDACVANGKRADENHFARPRVAYNPTCDIAYPAALQSDLSSSGRKVRRVESSAALEEVTTKSSQLVEAASAKPELRGQQPPLSGLTVRITALDDSKQSCRERQRLQEMAHGLGATVADQRSRLGDITHFVCVVPDRLEAGLAEKARKRQIHIVAVHWLLDCNRHGIRQPEARYSVRDAAPLPTQSEPLLEDAVSKASPCVAATVLAKCDILVSPWALGVEPKLTQMAKELGATSVRTWRTPAELRSLLQASSEGQTRAVVVEKDETRQGSLEGCVEKWTPELRSIFVQPSWLSETYSQRRRLPLSSFTAFSGADDALSPLRVAPEAAYAWQPAEMKRLQEAAAQADAQEAESKAQQRVSQGLRLADLGC
ncbi:unnamed protein product [Symbiodinium microadriaticum]|nr:unnamed protein product [Symbiodinium microadriaticum]